MSPQKVEEKKGQKPTAKQEEQKKKAAEGSTKPLPTAADNTPKEKKKLDKAINEHAKVLEEARKRLEEAKKQLEEAKKKEKAEKEAAKKAKDAEKEKVLAERMKKEKEIEEADAAIAKAQKDLELTDEWKDLVKAKERREKIGPLPKVPKAGGGGGGTRRAAASNGLTSKMVKILSVMDDGVQYGSAKIAELTGIEKGKPFPLMEEMGLLKAEIHEGERGKRFTITKHGREELNKAQAELASKA